MQVRRQNVTHHTCSSKTNYKRYELGHSPIKNSVVEKCLESYPDQKSGSKLLNGLELGFSLNYADLRISAIAKSPERPNSNTKAVREKKNKIKLSLG